METIETNFTEETLSPQRPDFLKILCILSFVASGLMILIYTLGSFALSLSQDMIDEVWPQMAQSYPQFESLDGAQFFHEVGTVCVYGLIANIFSLLGVIMMWRLEKIGFFIYTIAEISTNFFSLNINTGEEGPQYGSMIFSIVIDLIFIVMYYMNLKHMKGKTTLA